MVKPMTVKIDEGLVVLNLDPRLKTRKAKERESGIKVEWLCP